MIQMSKIKMHTHKSTLQTRFFSLSGHTTQAGIILLYIFCALIPKNLSAQSFFEPSDTFNKKRFYPIAISGAAITVGAFIALDKVWYSQQQSGNFRLFNDYGEWGNKDKWGHSTSAYYESAVVYQVAKWTGMSKNAAIWSGFGVASAFQLTFEIMDGHIETYGFSIPDVAFNTLGAGTFAIQQLFWDRQWIQYKMSTRFRQYPETPLLSASGNATDLLSRRASDLYGKTYGDRFLKDYNALNYWISVFPGEIYITEKIKWPEWLGISFGHSAENIFGANSNSWTWQNELYTYPEERYRQYFLSLDIDWTKIPVRSPFLKSLFNALQFVKIPFPTLEWTSQGKFRGHLLFF